MKTKEAHPKKDPKEKKKSPPDAPGKTIKPIKEPEKTKKPGIKEPNKSYDKNKLKLYK